MLNYRHLHYFWVVTKEGGFARAAERLDMAVQTISAQVRELEKSLGHQLLKPSGRGVALTEAGEGGADGAHEERLGAGAGNDKTGGDGGVAGADEGTGREVGEAGLLEEEGALGEEVGEVHGVGLRWVRRGAALRVAGRHGGRRGGAYPRDGRKDLDTDADTDSDADVWRLSADG